MAHTIPRMVIAAPASGSGKSIIATGLMAALSEQYQVQGFKVGPDYIDPGYHTAATGRASRNLDTWMVSLETVKATFARATANADIAIIEGVMGLFDGYDAVSEEGSTAQVAKILNAPSSISVSIATCSEQHSPSCQNINAPVVLVLDVGKMARSAGALALGFRNFDPALQVAGVICNKVGGPQHATWVTQHFRQQLWEFILEEGIPSYMQHNLQPITP